MKRQRFRKVWLARRAAAAATAAAIAMATTQGTAAAQEAGGFSVLTVDATAHPEVGLTVTVPQELAGTVVPSEAFTLTEDGEARPVTATRVGGQELQVVLVIDTSGSMIGEPMEAARTAATSFVEQMPAGTVVSVVGFGDTPVVLSPPSTDRAAASAAVATLTATGETALYDAIDMGLRQFTPADGARYALVVLSDGGDTASATPFETVEAWLAEGTVEFAALELVTEEYDGAALHALAEAAGGSIVAADAPEELGSVYAAVASDLVNRYDLTYASASGGDTQLVISVAHDGVSASTSRSIRLPAAPPAAAAPPREALNDAPTWLASSAALALGLAFFAMALFVGGLLAFGHREQRVRSLPSRRHHAAERLGVSHLAHVATAATERMLERHGRISTVNTALERAGIDLRPAEFVVLGGVSAMSAFGLGWLVAGPAFGLLLAAVTGAGFGLALRVLADRRRARFADQLADTLQMLAGSLRAGYSLLQAADAVSREAAEPTSGEFRRMLVETRLGRDVSDAMRAMHARIGTEDFLWFIQAVEIQRDVGGDLAEILDTVSNTIRERNRVRRQIKTLSAEGRISALVLFVLPFVVAGWISLVNPGYISLLLDSGLGVAMLAGASTLLLLGGVWLKKLIRLQF